MQPVVLGRKQRVSRVVVIARIAVVIAVRGRIEIDSDLSREGRERRQREYW